MRPPHPESPILSARTRWPAAASAVVLAALCSLMAVAPAFARAQSFDLPAPQIAVRDRQPVQLTEDERRRYLVDWRRSTRPSFDAALFRWSLGGEAYFDGGETAGGSFAFDVDFGWRFVLEPGRRRGIALVPVVGYGLSAGDHTAHLVSAGLGLGYEALAFSATYYARLVAGGVGGASTLGVRHGASFELANVLGLHVAHEALAVDGRDALLHGVRITVSIDLSPFVQDPSEYFHD